MTYQNPSREILQQRADWAEAKALKATKTVEHLRRLLATMTADRDLRRSMSKSCCENSDKIEKELAALKAKPTDAKWVRELKWVKIESVDQIPVGAVGIWKSGNGFFASVVHSPKALCGTYVCILALPHEIPKMPEVTP